MANTLADAIIRIRSRYDSTGTDAAKRDVKSLENGIARAGQASSLLASRFRSAFLITSLAGGATAKVFADVEKAEIDLARITGLTGRSFVALRTEVTDAGKALGLTEAQSLGLATQAARLGIAGRDVVRFLTTAQKASVALNQDVSVTAPLLAKLRSNLQLTVGDLDRLTGAIIALDNVSNAAFPDILNAMTRVGPIAGLFGVSGQQLAALTTVLLEAGVSAQITGTTLSNIFSSLLRRSEDLAPLLGTTGDQLRRMVKENPVAVLRLVSQTFASLVKNGQDTSEFLKALSLDGRNSVAVLSLLGSRTARLDELLGSANAEVSRGTILQRLFGKSAESLAFKFQQWKSSIFGAASEIGRRLAPAIIRILEATGKLADAISKSPLLQYAIGFGIVGLAIATAVGFLTFFVASQVIAFKVAKQALPILRAEWAGVAASINAAALAQNRFSLGGIAGGLRAAKGGFLTGFRRLAPDLSEALFSVGQEKAFSRFFAIGGLLRSIGTLAGRAFLPIFAAVAVFQALNENIFGARDALVELVRPFREVFGGEGKKSLQVFFDLLKAITTVAAHLAAVLIRVVATILTPFVKLIAFLAEVVFKIVNFIGQLFSLGTSGGSSGDLPSRPGGSPPSAGTAASSFPTGIPLTSGGIPGSVAGFPLISAPSIDIPSGALARTTTINAPITIYGGNKDAQTIAKEVRRHLNQAAAKAGST